VAGSSADPPQTVRAGVLALTGTGVLNLADHTVSLPAGNERRDTEERER
jgi:hypothetical protein